jgi:TATA-binding protein-associated factor Taf7
VSELEHKVYESDQEKRVLLDQIKLLENEIMNLRRDNEELSNPVTLRRTLNNHNSMQHPITPGF